MNYRTSHERGQRIDTERWRGSSSERSTFQAERAAVTDRISIS
jgi:hypothetical protein